MLGALEPTSRRMTMIDATHNPALQSWVASANDALTDFPIQNLPYARLRPAGSGAPWRIGVAIGDQVLDLAAAAAAPAGWTAAEQAALVPLAQGDLKAFMALGPQVWQVMRVALSRVLAQGSPAQAALAPALLAQGAVAFSLPCEIGDYTDFYTGIHHATAVGKLFRPDNPLLPNYQWVPIGYHGRSSSIGISGQTFARPWGQLKGPNDEVPRYAPSQRLDHELELGVLIGQGNALGEPVSMADAEDHIFGLTLLNDWSARDVQAWEYQPLGPFLAKNFATTLSPWVVTMAALAPFRAPFERPAGHPQPLPYLDSAAHRARGLINITLEAWLLTPAMHAAGSGPQRLSQANYRDAAYWTLAQLVSHHTANGCNLRPGDLFGTGTLSGPLPNQAGSLLELSQGGKAPVVLANGETRTFLLDGDTLILRAWCEQPGARRIGLGECAGTVGPARPQSA
jgi:fumarylacetoacetase